MLYCFLPVVDRQIDVSKGETVMRLVVLMVVVSLVSISVADSISLGMFVDAAGYESAYTLWQDAEWSLYLEREPGYDYNLGILGYQDRSRQYLFRVESPDWIRLGISESKTIGDLSLKGQYLTGLGEPPHRLDLEAKMQLDQTVSLKGWARIRKGKKPDWFIGPQVSLGDLLFFYGHNLRSSGERTIIVNLEVMSW